MYACMHNCYHSVHIYNFICLESINSSPLSRRHAIRRSPQCSRRKVYKEESSFIDVSGFVDPTDPTEPAARQRGNSAGVESQRGSSFGKESRTKSLENVLQSGSDSVSELEKTVNLGSKPGNSDQLMTKERIELESSKKISPVVMRKAMDMKRSRDRCGTLFDEDDNTSPITRPRHNIGSGTAAAAAAAASKSEVCMYLCACGNVRIIVTITEEPIKEGGTLQSPKN